MDPHRFEQLEQISAYIDGELSEAERTEVEGWLAEDAELRRFYENARRLDISRQSLPCPPESLLADRVFARIDHSRRLVGSGLATAAVLTVAAVGYWNTLPVAEQAQAPLPTISALPEPTAAPRALEVVARDYLLSEASSSTLADPYTILLQEQEDGLLSAER
jgi:anti-sigma factor RsiW